MLCFDVTFVSLLLSTGIGPVLGLLFIPLIGSASDHCNSSYGRRRPFIWLLSLGVLVALLIIPHADILAARLAWGGRTLQVGNSIVVSDCHLVNSTYKAEKTKNELVCYHGYDSHLSGRPWSCSEIPWQQRWDIIQL